MTTSRDIALNIIADAKDFQREISKIPGYTDKSAASAAMKLSKQMQKGFKKTEKQSKKTGKILGNALSVGIGMAMAGIATVITRALNPGQFLSAAKEAADFTNAIQDMASATSFNADTLTGLQFMARATGSTLEQLRPALAGFAKRMHDTAMGTGEAKVGFDMLNVSVLDADGQMRDMGAVFEEATKKLTNMEAGQQKALATTALFGESGGFLTVAMEGAAMSVEEATLVVENYGLSTQQAIKASAQVQQMTAHYEMFSAGVKTSIMLEVVPLMSKYREQILNVAETTFHVFGAMGTFIANTGLVINEAFHGNFMTPKEMIDSYDDLFVAANNIGDSFLTGLENMFDGFEDIIVPMKTTFIPTTKKYGEEVEKVTKKTNDLKDAERELKEARDRSRTVAGQIRDINIELATGFEKLELEEAKATTAALAFVTAGESWENVAPLIDAIEQKYARLRQELEDLNAEAERTPKLAPGSEWIESSAVAMERTLAASNAITGAINAGFDAEMESIEAISAHRDKKIDQRKNQIAKLREQQEGASDAEKADIQEEINALVGKNRRIRRQQKKREKEMRRLWKGQKAARITEAIMNKGVAIARAYAELGPVAGPIFAVGVGTTLGFEISRIRKQRAPTFHSGMAGFAPDEGSAVLRRGESVLTQGATEALGKRNVEALNQGAPTSPSVFNFMLGGKVIESLVVDAVSGTATQRVLRPGAVAVGMVNPYVGR